jgi:hypothetical protein
MFRVALKQQVALGPKILSRNFGVCAPVCQAATASDPIQKMFVEKIRDYASKSK